MPITIDDVRSHMGSVPIIDPNSVMTEILRRFPMGGQELEGIKKDMVITRVIRDIFEQPQISGQSKWEDRFLFAKGEGATREEMGAWMHKSRRPITIRPNEYPQFFSWLKSFDMSPWDIEGVDSVRQTIKVMDKGRGLLTDIPFDAAMRHLKKGLRWSDADIFEYFEFKKSQGSEMMEALYNEVLLPDGYRLVYNKLHKGYVDVKKSVLANKSFILPELRGREVVNVIHHSTNGHEIMLGEFYGPDAINEAYKMAKTFANRMVQLHKGAIPSDPEERERKLNIQPGENIYARGDKKEPGQHWRALVGPSGYQTESAIAFTDPKTHKTQYPTEEERKMTGINRKPGLKKDATSNMNLLTRTVNELYNQLRKADPMATSQENTDTAGFPTVDPGSGAEPYQQAVTPPAEDEAMGSSYQPAPPVEDVDQGQLPDEGRMSRSVPPGPAFGKSLLAGDGNMLTMTVDQMYKAIGA